MGPMSYDYIAVLYAEKAAQDRNNGCEQPMAHYIMLALRALSELNEREEANVAKHWLYRERLTK